MGRHAADGMDEVLGQSLLLPYCCQVPGGASRVFYFLQYLQAKRKADERT
jgi:hypothetical protein